MAHPMTRRDFVKSAALFSALDQKKAGSLIVHGWVMAEDLVKLGAR